MKKTESDRFVGVRDSGSAVEQSNLNVLCGAAAYEAEQEQHSEQLCEHLPSGYTRERSKYRQNFVDC